MAEDTKTRQPADSKADTPVSDSQLSIAWDEVTGDKPQPEEKQEAQTDAQKTKDEENAERSRLGRKVADMERKFEKWGTTIDRLDQYLSTQEEQKMRSQYQQNQAEMPQIVSTPDDVEKVLQNRDRRMAEAKSMYQTEYLKTIANPDVREKDDGLHQEIVEEMMKNFNIMYAPQGQVGNPYSDSQINYNKAKASVFARKLQSQPGKKVTLGEKPSGVTTGTRQREEATDVPALDEYAQDFVRKLNIPQDDIKRAFSKELPWYMTGGRPPRR